MTKREMFKLAIKVINETGVAEKAELVEGLQHEFDLLTAKAGRKTPTKTQKENEVLMQKIVADLAEFDAPVTVTELIAGGEGLEGLTNQKVSALLRKLVESGVVAKSVNGKKATFALA